MRQINVFHLFGFFIFFSFLKSNIFFGTNALEEYARALKPLCFAELKLFRFSDEFKEISDPKEQRKREIQFILDFIKKEKERHPCAADVFEVIE